jgi:hypothetical protein
MKKIALTLLVAFAVFTPAVFAQDAAAAPKRYQDLVGSYRCTGSVEALSTWNNDNTFTVSMGMPNTSTGHGTWHRTGPDTFRSTNDVLFFQPDGSVIRLVADGEGQLDDNNGFDMDLDFNFYTMDGTLVDTDSASEYCSRIDVTP